MKILIFFIFAISLINRSFSQVNLKEGDTAPEFTLQADDGSLVKLSDYKEKSIVVLYFYPKDFTSGCTAEACNFRDNISAIQEQNAVVLGVSVDNRDSHEKFREEYKLNYTLLADTTKEITSMYAGLKNNGLANRVTFIIDKGGIIRKIYPSVDVNENYKDIIEFLKTM